MEAGDNVHEIRRRSFNTLIPPSPMLAPSRSSSGSTSCPQKKPKGTARPTSRAWQFFDIVQKEDSGPDGKKIQTRVAKCKYCQKILTASSANGTRHLLAHSKRCDEKHYTGRGPTQSTLKFNSDCSVGTFSYDLMVARESLARLIASTDLPISFGENTFYEEHIQRSFCPQFKAVTRKTIRSDIISYYSKKRTALISYMNTNTFCIALTSDIWAARSNQDYISVVSH